MKRWMRVGVPLLLACLVSLGAVSLLYGRVDRLAAGSSRSRPRAGHTRHVQLQQALDALARLREAKDSLHGLNKAPPKTSQGITLAVVEEHHEGK